MQEQMLRAFAAELEKLAKMGPGDVKAPAAKSHAEFLAKLQPGDIVLSRGHRAAGKLVSFIQKVRGLPPVAAKWTHAGVYVGDGKIRHAYSGIQGTGLSGTSRVRDHALKALHGTGQDLLVLRPQVSKKLKNEAVTRSKALLNRGYSAMTALRAGLKPLKRRAAELKAQHLPDDVICTSVVGYSYPKLRFGKKSKSIHNLLPADLLTTKGLKPVAALSESGGSKKFEW